jgi:hypothetical protein
MTCPDWTDLGRSSTCAFSTLLPDVICLPYLIFKNQDGLSTFTLLCLFNHPILSIAILYAIAAWLEVEYDAPVNKLYVNKTFSQDATARPRTCGLHSMGEATRGTNQWCSTSSVPRPRFGDSGAGRYQSTRFACYPVVPC